MSSPEGDLVRPVVPETLPEHDVHDPPLASSDTHHPVNSSSSTPPASPSSFSSLHNHHHDEDDGDAEMKYSAPRKFRLFGRQQSVHNALGGGKPADIILWRNKQIPASLLSGATVIWLLFEWIGYHLLAFVSHFLILTLSILFLWSCLFSTQKSRVKFPEIAVPEEVTNAIALLARDRINWVLARFHEVGSGRDLKKFLYTIIILWLLSSIGSWFDFLTLTYIMFVTVLTVPLLYEKHEDRVDAYAEKATGEIKKKYRVLDQKVLQKLPSMPKDRKR